MVDEKQTNGKCGSCREVTGDVWQGYVHCAWLNCDVWAYSLKCQHGQDLDDCF